VLPCVAVCCSVLQCVAVCCSALQCVCTSAKEPCIFAKEPCICTKKPCISATEPAPAVARVCSASRYITLQHTALYNTHCCGRAATAQDFEEGKAQILAGNMHTNFGARHVDASPWMNMLKHKVHAYIF